MSDASDPPEGPPGKTALLVVLTLTAVAAAALFTTNLAQAAPVLVSKAHLRETSGHARAVVVNDLRKLPLQFSAKLNVFRLKFFFKRRSSYFEINNLFSS